MNVIRALTLGFIIICCCSCGATGNSSESVTGTITYKSATSGMGLAELAYTETVSISGDAMHIERLGGAWVNSGTCGFTLKTGEVIKMNELISLATPLEISDRVSDSTIYDIPSATLDIGSKNFNYGMVRNENNGRYELHEFPAEATNLVTYIENLMASNCGSRFSR